MIRMITDGERALAATIERVVMRLENMTCSHNPIRGYAERHTFVVGWQKPLQPVQRKKMLQEKKRTMKS